MVLGDLADGLRNAIIGANKSLIADDKTYKNFVRDVCNTLIQADVSINIVMQVRKSILDDLQSLPTGSNVRKVMKSVLYKELLRIMTPKKTSFIPQRNRVNVFMVVGLQGAGKTTTVMKLARFYKARNWRVGVVAADTFRAGAYDQLLMNAKKIGVQCYGDRLHADPVRVACDGVTHMRRDHNLIIVDTSGRHSQDAQLFQEMKQIQSAIEADECIFVMDGSIGQSATTHATAFHNAIGVGSMIITKLDSSAKGGGAISAIASTGCPITFYGTGEHSTDLHEFNPSGFVSKILGMGDIHGAIYSIADVSSKDDRTLIENSIKKNNFTLREYLIMMRTVNNSGGIRNMLSMIPGVTDGIISEIKDNEDINSAIILMQSMTDNELDNPNLLKGSNAVAISRRNRIIRGSGQEHGAIDKLLMSFQKIKKIASNKVIRKMITTGRVDQNEMIRAIGSILHHRQRR